ncbi:hypothetical protein Dimus_003221 [Dionaea muscipula]
MINSPIQYLPTSSACFIICQKKNKAEAKMEKRMNHLKLRLCKMFRSSFASCKLVLDTSKVITQHQFPNIVSTAQDHDSLHSRSSSSRRPNSDPNLVISTPRRMLPPHGTDASMCPETFDGMIRDNCFLHMDYYYHSLPRRRISQRCPPVSPVSSPLMNYLMNSQTEMLTKNTKNKSRRRTRTWKKNNNKKKKGNSNINVVSKRTHLKENVYKKGDAFLFPNIISSSNDEDWFSSDDEREDEKAATTLFSSLSLFSKSLSSDNSDSNRVPQAQRPDPHMRMKRSGARRGRAVESDCEPTSRGNVRGGFAVVKSSSDPYTDFRTSMVEMIVERQMFGAQELEMLLKCFLHLNSPHHHKLIVEVFAEILETLFPPSN